jgi:SAM-dependent methyltransferase
MIHEFERHWDHIADQMGGNAQAFHATYPGQSVLAALRHLLPVDLDGAGVLDIGCGTGRYFPFLSALGATRLVGLDIGPSLLAACQQHNPAVSLALAHALHLPFASHSFEIVISMGLVEHFRDPTPVLDEFVRLLRPGGTLILETPNLLNLVFSLYKIIHRKSLAWERWLGPWSLSGMVKHNRHLTASGFASAILASWLLTRLVNKAGRGMPCIPNALIALERLWPFRYLGSMMFVSAHRH